MSIPRLHETASRDEEPQGSSLRREIKVPMPSARGVPTCTAVLGASSLAGALLHGDIAAESRAVWPLVVLVIACMGYDLGLRALRRRRQ